MKKLWHGCLDFWDNLDRDNKELIIIAVTLFSIFSFVYGACNANKTNKGRCVFNTRAGKLNLPYRFGCWMLEELER